MYEQSRWHPYSYEGRRPNVPDQAILMADIEEMQEKRKIDDETEKKMKEHENVMSERKAAEIAAYDSPFIGRATGYVDYHHYVDARCTSCSSNDRAIANLTLKNANLEKDNDELRRQVMELQDEVAMQERNAHYAPYRRFL